MNTYMTTNEYFPLHPTTLWFVTKEPYHFLHIWTNFVVEWSKLCVYQITSDTVFALLLSALKFYELGLVKQWCAYAQLLLEWGPHTLYPSSRVKNVYELLLDWRPHMLNTSRRKNLKCRPHMWRPSSRPDNEPTSKLKKYIYIFSYILQ